MKRTMTVMMAALLMSSAIPAFPADTADTPQEQYICKLEARKCQTQMEVVQEKIKKMTEGVEKGTTYSETDMKQLQMKLKELNDLLDKMKPVGK